MQIFLSIATLLVATAYGSPTSSVLSSRIYGGNKASIKDFPYQVSIDSKYFPVCGGSIVAQNWVLTSALCAQWVSRPDTIILAGTNRYRTGGSQHHVEKKILHEDFRTNSMGITVNDIALVRVKEAFVFDETRKPISLFNAGEQLTPGAMANVSGFGSVQGGYRPDFLQFLEVPIVDSRSCNETYVHHDFGSVPEGHVCAGYVPDGGRVPCAGDEGGPLVVQGRLAGVVSYIRKCFFTSYPVLYTDVAYYNEWISRRIQI